MAHEHWDGSSRPRNVDYPTRRLGDREPYPRRGSSSPGGVYRGRRGRLEVTLRSYSCVQEYRGEGVNPFPVPVTGAFASSTLDYSRDTTRLAFVRTT